MSIDLSNPSVDINHVPTTELQIGLRHINHTFVVINDGPSRVTKSELTVLWPGKVTNNRYLLYIMDIRVCKISLAYFLFKCCNCYCVVGRVWQMSNTRSHQPSKSDGQSYIQVPNMPTTLSFCPAICQSFCSFSLYNVCSFVLSLVRNFNCACFCAADCR